MKDQTLSLVKLAQELCNSGHTPRDATGHLLILAREHAELAYLLDADQEQAIAELERRFSGYVVKPWECRYIIETPNQLWGGYSYDNTYPVALYQRGESRHAKLHQFADLAIAKEVLSILSRERGGAKLKIYQLADDEQRVEVQQ